MMDFLRIAVVLCLVCFLGACDDHRTHVAPDEDIYDLPDFVYIRSAGDSVILGSNDASAPPKERTEMKVLFTYNYYINQHEVTCSEFNTVMMRTPNVPCNVRKNPAINVNYYDAILYANAFSKRQKFDTAYTYESARFDDEGHCLELEGLKFNADVEAYRLPTEAEWVYAAKPGWNTRNAWTNELSNYRVQPVCSQPKNFLELCDMSGNAAEWVGDWLGYFSDTTVTNYIGAVDGGNFGERIIKGGSVAKDPKNISYLSRLDVYPITATSKGLYIGFRLAFGKIPDPTMLAFNGSASHSNVFAIASPASVKEMTGSFYTKLAFRNDVTGNLMFLDYSTGSRALTEIVDTIPVYHPDISPDGRWVAFSTVSEGIVGKSELYVRKLNESGDGLVKLDVESAAIPRWRVLPSGDTVIVYVTSAADNSQSAEFENASTWQVSFANGTFGEPLKLFDGAYHGGISSDDALAVSGARLLRARVAENESTVMASAADEIWYNGEQACNVSLSKGSSKQTLFLDFASATGKEFVGSKYSVHQRLFIADEKGNLVRSIQSPQGYTFDHSEWIVGDTSKVDANSGLVTASLTNPDGAHPKIILLDTRDGSYITLAEGDELWQPCVWVKQNTQDFENILLSLDSTGMYFDFVAAVSELIMKVKMRMFWDMKDSLELFAVGTSRTERGFAPLMMTSYKSMNFGYSGGELWGELYLTQNYLLNHAKNMKVLVMELPLDLQSNTPDFRYETVFGQAPGYFYDKNHDFWKDGLPEYFISILHENISYSEQDEEDYVSTMGLLRTKSEGWKGNEVDRDSLFNDIERGHYYEVLDSLDEFIENTKDLGIKLVLVMYPQSPEFAKTGSFGRHGVQRSIAAKTIAHYEEMDKRYPHLVFMDENKMGNHEYTDEMALDFDHLCETGAIYFTQKLDSLLKAWK